VLLLDEPLGALDRKLREAMQVELRQIQKQLGITTVFVTHDQEEAMSIADRIAVMNAGVLEQMDAPEEIYARPASLFVATFIGTMNRLEGSVDPVGWLTAGPFRVRMADAARIAPGQPVVAGIRPEDLLLESGGQGAPARLDSSIDLGHYRRVNLSVDGTSLLAFVPKSESIPTDSLTVRPSRVLVYADGRLAGVGEQSVQSAVSA